ncbi:MAG: tRNA pseudouridine(55) synthase TruB [Desulfobacteraceae bacterium]|jgi:tRNA pseudouridine55 synthase|nr:tRNA pseudouridine(55) synthase TruB [Desulfobacteraceae bacterium]
MDGVIVIDKPAGVTSARVVATVKRLLKGAKVGHTGTLDPAATGVLVCTMGRATRLARFFLAAPKTYRATCRLGADTDTQDAEGQVTATRPVTVNEAQVRTAAARFVGRITQVPPVFSALKHRGVPLYRLAREGKAVTKPPRPVTIYRLAVLAVDLPQVVLEIDCSAGTYVRTLCADLGAVLGCGGHLAGLRRTACAGFTLDEAVSLAELEDLVRHGRIAERIIDMNAALGQLEEVTANPTLARRIANGGRLTAVDIPPPVGEEALKVVDHRQRLLAVITFDPDTQRYDYVCVMPHQTVT